MTIKNIETMSRGLWDARDFLLDLENSTKDPKVKDTAKRTRKGIMDCLSIVWDEPNYWEYASNIS